MTNRNRIIGSIVVVFLLVVLLLLFAVSQGFFRFFSESLEPGDTPSNPPGEVDPSEVSEMTEEEVRNLLDNDSSGLYTLTDPEGEWYDEKRNSVDLMTEGFGMEVLRAEVSKTLGDLPFQRYTEYSYLDLYDSEPSFGENGQLLNEWSYLLVRVRVHNWYRMEADAFLDWQLVFGEYTSFREDPIGYGGFDKFFFQGGLSDDTAREQVNDGTHFIRSFLPEESKEYTLAYLIPDSSLDQIQSSFLQINPASMSLSSALDRELEKQGLRYPDDEKEIEQFLEKEREEEMRLRGNAPSDRLYRYLSLSRFL